MQGMNSDLIALLTSLVAVDSVNPSLVRGGAGEGEIAASSSGWAREHGLDAERLEETPGRPSVLVRARGTGGGRTLLLCGHLDVVNVEGMADPFTPRIDGDRMYGRGAYDMKAGVAAALVAARDGRATRAGGRRRGRRGGRRGARQPRRPGGAAPRFGGRSRRDRADRARARPLRTRASSGARSRSPAARRTARGPHLGVDAILKMGPVLSELERARPRAGASARTRCWAARSLHASLIEGGVELSSYPAQCTLSLERRTLPGETGEQIEAEVEAAARALPRGGPCVACAPSGPCWCATPSRSTRTTPSSRSRPASPPRFSARRSGSAARAIGPTRRSSPLPASRPSCSAPVAKAPTPSRSG